MPLLQVDAFTICQYAGNPAGVCLLASPGDPAILGGQAVTVIRGELAG